ncbi:ParB N-terminal domain-containing protein [Paenibacillus sp. YYML68]|uniref:ParB/RepB/Spo0J family partition protein n=1 Tax=Paenibacillus sp. YYML68 TaxID=2909250 RepID=UPI0024922B32|nr:ParB N-terminal domain-containing protein [Paenibacillus sp. YYML68]
MQNIRASLDNLFLDPNNYRLHSHARYSPISEDKVTNPLVQKRVLDMICGDNRENIRDLIDSFKTNGYLKIDNILVKKVPGEKNGYVVIEGNRRVATLKSLKNDLEQGYDIGKISEEDFSEIEVVLYDDLDEESYLLLMGLRHVSGIKPWSDFEQAELIMNLHSHFNMDQQEISNRLGISRQEVKRKLNSFIAMNIYKSDDEFGDNFHTGMAALFHELMSRPNLREWLGWNESLITFTNIVNLKRFFGWISRDELGKVILSKRDQIRDLSKIILDNEALNIMENSKNIEEALDRSNYLTTEGFRKNLKSIKNNISRIPIAALINMDEETKKDMDSIIKSIEAFKKVL